MLPDLTLQLKWAARRTGALDEFEPGDVLAVRTTDLATVDDGRAPSRAADSIQSTTIERTSREPLTNAAIALIYLIDVPTEARSIIESLLSPDDPDGSGREYWLSFPASDAQTLLTNRQLTSAWAQFSTTIRRKTEDPPPRQLQTG